MLCKRHFSLRLSCSYWQSSCIESDVRPRREIVYSLLAKETLDVALVLISVTLVRPNQRRSVERYIQNRLSAALVLVPAMPV